MKKLSFLFVLIYLTISNLHAQDFILTFNAKDASNTIDSIKATKVESGETSFVEGSNTINMSSFTTGTKLFPSNPEELSVYPNPFEHSTLLKFHSNQNENIKVSLINAAGQVVAEKKQNVTPGIHQFNISTNNNGLYILNVTGNQTKFSHKIISAKNNQSQNKIEYSGYSSMSSIEKSAKAEGGELIHFYVYSGENITKIVDSPTESKTYEVEFYECKDADGKSYPIVQIGDQWWMAENLGVGEMVMGNEGTTQFDNNIVEKYCYENNIDNCDKYGGLYQWDEMMNYSGEVDTIIQGICPKGWHVPAKTEWNKLISFLDGRDVAKEKPDENGFNILYSGFYALVGGSELSYSGLGNYSAFWTGTSVDHMATYAGFSAADNSMFIEETEFWGYGFSCRCVKDISDSIELNEQVCPNAWVPMGQITDGIGMVKTSPSTGINYIDYYKEYSDGGSFAAKLYPCNISNDQLIVGKKIKLSGVLYAKKDPDDDTIDSDFAQIVISSAEYVK